MSKQRLPKEALVDLVIKIMNAEGTEEELDQYMVLLKQNVPHPSVSDLIFYLDKELSPDEIVEIALSYKGIAVPEKKLDSDQ